MATEQEVEDYLTSMEQELRQSDMEKRKLVSAQNQLFGVGVDNENLIKYQLDLREELDRMYHLLRGDQLKENEKGQQYYEEAGEADLKPLNEFGTKLLINVLTPYLSRNTILSNYDEPTILNKCYDFGIEITDLIHNRYEEMFMTTDFSREFKRLYGMNLKRMQGGRYTYEKRGKYYVLTEDMVINVNNRLNEHLIGKMKFYPVIVRMLVDAVHSAYLRALNGGERGSLREARTVSQTEGIGKMQNIPTASQPRQKRLGNLFGLV